MRPIFVVAMLALFCVLPRTAAAQDCETSENQMELNLCAAEALEEADTRLNTAYRAIESRLTGEDDLKQRLRATQRAWITFRDAECRFLNANAEGGTIFPMLESQCLADITSERADKLEDYLVCDETDMSCPVPDAQ